jgi:RecB family exonuclease
VLDDPGLLADLRARAFSPSSLELWIACPTKWFVERMLRPERSEPEPEPLLRGALAHAALRDTLQGLRERTGSARLTPPRLALALQLLAEALARHEPRFPLSAQPERLPGARRRLAADLQRYLRHAAEQQSPLQPLHLELPFGFQDEDPHGLPALALGEGLRLRGRIDRIDVTPGGEAVVYDYKGANVTPGARWLADGKVQLALYMRAAEDLLGLRVIGGFYQPLAGADLRARGALHADAAPELECVQTDRFAADELARLREDTLALARRAAREALAGEIAPRPATCAYEGGCTYPAICRCGR